MAWPGRLLGTPKHKLPSLGAGKCQNTQLGAVPLLLIRAPSPQSLAGGCWCGSGLCPSITQLGLMSHRGCPSPAWFALIWGGGCISGASGTARLLAWVARGKPVPDTTSTRLPRGQQAGGGHTEPPMLLAAGIGSCQSSNVLLYGTGNNRPWDTDSPPWCTGAGQAARGHGGHRACPKSRWWLPLAAGARLGQQRPRPYAAIPRASPRLAGGCSPNPAWS